MAVTKTDGRIIRMTADDDVYDSGLKVLQIKGCRLVAGSGADATAQLKKNNTNGEVVMSMAAAQKTSDDSAIPFVVEGGTIHLDLSGTGAEVFVYLE